MIIIYVLIHFNADTSSSSSSKISYRDCGFIALSSVIITLFFITIAVVLSYCVIRRIRTTIYAYEELKLSKPYHYNT